MRRNLNTLTQGEYDLVVIGGGIFGVCAAWDAASRGLSVILLEREDFSHATSANHLKMIHGGIRYLQHADISRVRESSRERSALITIAPHLSYAFPIAIPTYGHGMKGKEILRAGLFLYDFLTYDRNRTIADPGRKIPRGSVISRRETLQLFPGLNGDGLTGAVVFHDGQMYSPPRLAISFLRSAVRAGADVANYLEVLGFLSKGDRVLGVKARDVLSGEELEIRGRIVLNAAGPWAGNLLHSGLQIYLDPAPIFSRDLGFVIQKRMFNKFGLACQVRSADADAVVSRGGRHIFIVPWRGDYSLVGCWHEVYRGSLDEITVTERELQFCIDEMNQYYPDLSLTLDDVSMVNTGLTLFAENKPGSRNISFGKRSLIIDHEKEHGKKGLVTLIGVRATTARGVAERAINLIFRKIGKEAPVSKTAVTPIYGGDIACFSDYLESVLRENPHDLKPEVVKALIHNYGCEYKEVTKYIDENPEWAESIDNSTVIKAEIIHAIREEMAVTLADVVFRRTDFGTAGDSRDNGLETCGTLMARELGWNEDRLQRELNEIRFSLSRHGSVKKYKPTGELKWKAV